MNYGVTVGLGNKLFHIYRINIVAPHAYFQIARERPIFHYSAFVGCSGYSSVHLPKPYNQAVFTARMLSDGNTSVQLLMLSVINNAVEYAKKKKTELICIYAPEGSYAARYAVGHNIAYSPIPADPDTREAT